MAPLPLPQRATGEGVGEAQRPDGDERDRQPAAAPASIGQREWTTAAASVPASTSRARTRATPWGNLGMMRPGEHPLKALERGTSGAAPLARLLIAVDQFEELFTLCRDEQERAAFVSALVSAAEAPDRRASVVLAVRADFYGHCAAYPELARLLGANQVLVGPMNAGELRRVIELPARRAGLHVEPRLVDRMLADVEAEPGALPLLSTALLELWQRRDGDRLRLADYAEAGGVRGAVARLAEAAYERLQPDHPDRRAAHLAPVGRGRRWRRARAPPRPARGARRRPRR